MGGSLEPAANNVMILRDSEIHSDSLNFDVKRSHLKHTPFRHPHLPGQLLLILQSPVSMSPLSFPWLWGPLHYGPVPRG